MAIIEFIIAVVFICLLISLFVSWIIDIYANQMNRKGRFLQKMLIKLIGQDDSINWAARLYRHPMIESLSYKSSRLTSYIPSKVFSNVLADLIIEEGRDYSIAQNKETKKVEYKEDSPEGFIPDLKKGIQKMPESDLKRTVKLFLEKSGDDPDKFFSGLEEWFNEYMVRVNHTYKRLLRLPLWILGIMVAVSFNIDAIRITTTLWTDTQMSSNVAAVATEFAEQHPNLDEVKLSKEFFKEYEKSLGLPIGWKYEKEYKNELKQKEESSFGWNYWLMKILGFVLTGMIASFGAPFWYDALHKIVGLKKSIKIKKE